MDAELLHYSSGEDVQLGDRVQFNGAYATVVAISDGENYQLAPGYEDYAGAQRSVIVCDDDGEVSSLDDSDTRLIFMDRGSV